jgi:hypothetical protein
MANRFWVGGTGNWDAATTTHWSATTGGAGGASVPTTTDDVFFNANSGAGTVTVTSASIIINSLDMTGFAQTLAGSAAISIATVTNGTSVVCKFAGTITWTGQLNLDALSTATITLTSNAKTLSSIAMGNTASTSTGTYVFADGLTVGTAATISLVRGTLHVSGAADSSTLTHSWGLFASVNGNTRSLFLGNASITITGTGTSWSTGSTITLTPGTSTITFNNAAAGAIDFGGKTFNSVVFNGPTNPVIGSFGASFTNLTVTGAASKTASLTINGSPTTIAISGTLNLTGNSTINRLIVGSNIIGTAATLAVTTGVTLNNVDFRDITTSGTPWNVGTATIGAGGVGDCGGNTASTIGTYTASVTQFWKTTTTGSKTWSTVGNWFLATNGVGAGRIPLPQDDVVFDANSIGAINHSYTGPTPCV